MGFVNEKGAVMEGLLLCEGLLCCVMLCERLLCGNGRCWLRSVVWV